MTTTGKPVKVAFSIQPFPPYLGGAERQAEIFASELAAKDAVLEGAVASLEEVLQIDPQQVGALVRRGRILLELGHSRQAEADLSRALLIDDSHTDSDDGTQHTFTPLRSLT